MNESAYSEALETLLGTIRHANSVVRFGGGHVARPLEEDHVVGTQSFRLTKRGLETANGLIEMLKSSGRFLEGAKPMFWGRQPTDLVFEVAKQIDLETSLEPDLLYCESAWCWFDTPRMLTPDGQYDEPLTPAELSQGLSNHVRLWALSWTWGTFETPDDGVEEGLCVIGWTKNGRSRSEQIPAWIGFVKNGAPLSQCRRSALDDIDFPEVSFLVQFAIAAGAFLRTRLASNERRIPERHARKRIAKDGGVSTWTGESHLIEVVMLRHREHLEDDREGRTVDWQHQWIVRAHTRQQWYPKRQKHLPILVMPHLKGPEGKPLKAPTQQVFAVTR